MSVLDRKELEQSPLADLHAIASELGVEGYRRLRKEELIAAILDGQNGDDAGSRDEEPDETLAVEAEAEPADEGELDQEEEPGDEEEEDEPEEQEDEPEEQDEPEEEDLRSGVLDILPNGSGFMRPDPFAHSRDDVYVSPAQIRRCELRAGDEITGPVRPPRRSERYPSLVRVDNVNGSAPEPPTERARFEQLTPVFASERLPAPEGLDAAPYGKGSRVAIAGPPGAGATTMLRRIVGALAEQPARPRPDRRARGRASRGGHGVASRRRRDRRGRRLRRLRRGAGPDRRDGHRARQARGRGGPRRGRGDRRRSTRCPRRSPGGCSARHDARRRAAPSPSWRSSARRPSPCAWPPRGSCWKTGPRAPASGTTRADLLS